MRFGTWNIRTLYRIGSLKTVARELGKYRLDIVGIQEVRWEKGGTERAEDNIFLWTGEWGSSVRDRIFRT
jgi:exonuclease III